MKLFYLLFTLVIFISGVSFFFYVSSKKLKKEILSRKLVEEENLIRANVLEKLINGDDIDSILESIVFALQKSFPSSVSSILLVDTDKEHLVLGAALGLPEFYKKAINGLKIGPDNCSCGSAAYLKKMVVMYKDRFMIRNNISTRSYVPKNVINVSAHPKVTIVPHNTVSESKSLTSIEIPLLMQ